MSDIEQTNAAQAESMSFEFELQHSPEKVWPALTDPVLMQSGFKPEQKQNVAGARYGWKMMGGKLVDLLARIP